MFALLVSLSCIINLEGASSSPVPGHPNTDNTISWVPEPNTRGTLGILSSSLLTFILCLWTSLHLNIPRKGRTVAGRMGTKLAWSLLALILPELVVIIAWRQWVSAKALCAEVNENLKEQGKIERWTIVHGFYAVMGGFVVEINDPASPILRNRPTPFRVALTSHGVSFLSKHGHLPHIPENFIVEKSSADSVAKFLFCIQAIWCLLQYIGRLVTSLPVTPLEINTLGHVLCTVAIYVLWWHKPLDISEPYTLSGGWVPGLGAYMWMQSQISRRTFSFRQNNCELYYLGRTREPPSRKPTTDDAVTLGKGQILLGTRFHFKSPDKLQLRRARGSVDLPAVLQPEDVRRWRLASTAMDLYAISLDSSFDHARPWQQSKDFVAPTVSNIPGNDLVGSVSSRAMAGGLALLSATYGGLHISALYGYFPSDFEATMWKLFSIWVLMGGISAPLFMVTTLKYFPPNDFMIYTICCGCRFFLVIEAFMSIRKLPVDAYKTPTWTQLLLHL